MLVYAVWNNKGGTGKTSLSFQMICRYAEDNPKKKILVVDMCPQANISELFLGGLQNNGSAKLLERQGLTPRCSIGGYFDMRIPTAHNVPPFNAKDYITSVSQYNDSITANIDLVCGDPLLELQSIAMNSLANLQLPGINTWIGVVEWLKNFVDQVSNDYDMIFIDTNPSFAMFTQIAIAATDRVILPVMADDSSRRAIQNAFSLIYGVKLHSAVYAQYTFSSKMTQAGKKLPKIHLILRNRLTQYMGTASAYDAVLSGIHSDLNDLLKSYSQHFTFSNVSDGMLDIRDFGTTGVVAFSRGNPFSKMMTGKVKLGTKRVEVKEAYRVQALQAIESIVKKL